MRNLPDAKPASTLDTMKSEIDALQVQVMKGTAPWYKQIPVVVSLLVSVMALGFSFWTNERSENRIERQDQHALRAELRGLVQRLSALPKENFELSRTYATDGEALRLLTGLTNTENVVLAQQAAELIGQLPGQVSSLEYYATAYALTLGGGQTSEAIRLLSEGLKVAHDPISEGTLLRQYAGTLFSIGEAEAGREKWQRALDVFGKYPERNALSIASSRAFTEMAWAAAELGLGNCVEAEQHVKSANDDVPLGHAVLQTQIEAAAKAVNEQCAPAM